MDRALIIGIDSVIGKTLRSILLTSGWSVFGTTRNKDQVARQVFYLNLAEEFNLNFIKLKFSVAYLCASVTQVAACSQQKDYARRVNVDAQIQLAKALISKGTQVVFLSSNAVFSGAKPRYKIIDVPCPVTLYGEYKAFVEQQLLTKPGVISIVRLTKVLTQEFPLFLAWISDLKQGKHITPFQDLLLSPLPIAKVVYCLKEVAEKKLQGIIHLSGDDEVSYYDAAKYLAYKLNVDLERVVPTFHSLDKVALHASLDTSESKKIFNLPNLSFINTMDSLFSTIQ